MDKTRIPLPRVATVSAALRPYKPKPQPAGLRRRSKSTSDLKSLTTTGQFVKFSKGPTALSANTRTANITARSTSTTNLRCIATNAKPLAVPKTIPERGPLKVNTIRQPVKRPAEKKPEEVVKPKVLKPNKPAPYDYKARFGLLQEKHSSLLETHRELKKQHVDAEEQRKLFEELKQKHMILLEENAKNAALVTELKLTNESLFKDVRDLSNQGEQLKTLCSDLTSAKASLEDECNELKERLTQTTADFERTRAEKDERTKEVHSLREDIQNHETLRRNLHNQIQDLKGNIRVFCRIRPHLRSEEDKLLASINYADDKSLDIRKTKESVSSISGKPNDFRQEFCFDKVFPPESTQYEIFEDLAQLVQSALDGYNICVFAYGQTGSGKTYTMQGSDGIQTLGMIPRTVDLIFDKIEKLKAYGWSYEVQASFLEIYNENVRDLLNPSTKEVYEIRYNEGKGTTVTNLKTEVVQSAAALRKLMALANSNRAVAATDFNEHSSRSHAVTRITLQGANSVSGAAYIGSLHLVDLAGSESAKTSSSERITETKSINKSLCTLGNVMLALHNNDSHIPYRNSKLTYLLQSSLGGNSKTLMIVNVAPFEECYNETINSLRFAAKVKEVKTASRRNRAIVKPEC